MNEQKVIEAGNYYQNLITILLAREKFPNDPQRLNPHDSLLSRSQKLNHLLWMALEVPKLVSMDKREKAMRWICFIQGSLWSMDIITIAEAKKQNRSD